MKKSFVYGPVPSRRLGLSLGVDIVPYKKCPLDCIYCQIGRTPETSIDRQVYIPADRILTDVREKLSNGIDADHISLGGSGEPTLNSDIGTIIRQIKEISAIPVAVLTNGALLGDPEVRNALSAADVVLPSLDAPDEAVFQRINRPHPEISFAALVDGLIAFRKEYSGQIWLEIFFIDGFNTADDHLQGFRKLIDRIAPDKVHLNTAIRPTAEDYAGQVPEKILEAFVEVLGERAEVIADFPREQRHRVRRDLIDEDVLGMLSRRPCTIKDIAAGLKIPEAELIAHVQDLVDRKVVQKRHIGDRIYYSGN